MTAPSPKSNLGRHLFGAAALASGLITLLWHDYNDWPNLRHLVYAASAAEILAAPQSNSAAPQNQAQPSWP